MQEVLIHDELGVAFLLAVCHSLLLVWILLELIAEVAEPCHLTRR